MTSTMSWDVSVRCSKRQIQKQFLVQLQSPDRRKVIALGVQEQIVEERPGSFDRRRLTRPQTTVDFDHRLFLRHRPFHLERVENDRRRCRPIKEDDLEFFDFAFNDLFDHLGGQALIFLHQLVLLGIDHFAQHWPVRPTRWAPQGISLTPAAFSLAIMPFVILAPSRTSGSLPPLSTTSVEARIP